jgi:translation initiation factor 2D
VGECEIDVSALKEVRGAKGHAVKGLHWDGDEIWAWAQSGAAKGVPAPDHIEGWDVEAVDPVSDGVQALDLSKSEDEADEGGVAVPNGQGSRNEFVDGELIQSYEEVQVEHKEMSTKGMQSSFNFFLKEY